MNSTSVESERGCKYFNPMADESINSLPKNLEQDNMKDMADMLQEYTVKSVAYYYVLGVWWLEVNFRCQLRVEDVDNFFTVFRDL